MKSSYELAMERLNKVAPAVKLTDAQKKQIAELEAITRAKIADREIFTKGKMDQAAEKGDFDRMEQLEQQLAKERKTAQAELEEKREKIRRGVNRSRAPTPTSTLNPHGRLLHQIQSSSASAE